MFCRTCQTEKHEDEFPRNRSKLNGRGSVCNDCNYEKVKVWRQNNKDKVSKFNKQYYERRHGTSSAVCEE